ncbi:hypothetical protein BU26DRAFT_512953 [Trematosphaeria pertusa]|uniref:Uncharacterized protein n=1 Tax=Trematosphaeria pertusa TaxID=390896 RepID=A0A6A6IZP2_9PLEO|nr:uncharacterized protein BU26DRAFT_512953 [Trematosphaeria pertusa]KAF2256055.1 hypothetical protein BU26DRAFT_512953 [Trematosphaeria pertusa]
MPTTDRGFLAVFPQHQSSFFRLPRELRYLCYSHYLFEENGYHHVWDGCAGKLRCCNNSIVALDLMYTCKAAANEMHGLPFQANTITFTAGDLVSEHSLCSDALRFKRLVDYATVAKWRILLAVADTVTPDDLAKLIQRFPRTGPSFVNQFQTLRDRNFHSGPEIHRIEYNLHGKHVVASREALEFALELAASHPEFQQLAAKALPQSPPPKDDPLDRNVGFMRGSHCWVLDFKPEAWTVPDETQLDSLESLLWWDEEYPLNLEFDPRPFGWYFSATAMAIAFLKHLGSDRRTHIRRIIIDEKDRAVSSPEVHARGLIPFCVENPRLRIERRVDLWGHVIPSRWGATADLSGLQYIQAWCLLQSLADWILEANDLYSRGMPSNSFSLVFQGDQDQHVWNMAKEAAAFQETFVEYYRRHNSHPPPLSHQAEHQVLPWPLPWHAPAEFPIAMKEIARGTSIVRTRWALDKGRDIEEMIAEHDGWPLIKWRRKWQWGIIYRKVSLPPGGAGTNSGPPSGEC